DNVIPGDHGRIFGTNAKDQDDLMRIQRAVMEIPGIKDVLLDETVYPREFTVHTTKPIAVTDIEHAVQRYKFHAIPKEMFPL
ncbi:heavy-metal-associated domain-containing protein, partial [Fulvivirga sp. RKSG066]|uniref:heavy-metal-associated domain-containing protein n=1 Tax=Fulvivirga aurantia TaxID=2529383 RepID=UPI0016255B13